MHTLDDLSARFRSLIGSPRRAIPIADPAAPSAPDLRQLRADRLHDWAARPESLAALKWIDSEIALANASAHREVGTARTAYWLGIEAGLRAVRDEMLNWQNGGQPSDNLFGRPAS